MTILILLCGFSLTVGSRQTPFIPSLAAIPDAINFALFPANNPLVGDPSEHAQLAVLIGGLRIPRTLVAVITGVTLGIAGAIIQGHTRNPLADPGVLGINAGGAAAIVGATYLGLSPSAWTAPLYAIAGAGIITVLVFLLSSTGKSSANPMTIILAGTALTALLMAFVNAMVLTSTQALDSFRSWATGSVEATPMQTFWVVLPFAVVGVLLAVPQGRALNLLGLGEASAHALGLPVQRYRVLGIVAVAVLGGTAVAGAGPIAFLGLAAPHIVRSFTGPDYRLILPFSAAVGGILALSADIISRIVVQPAELQMGIVLALVGVPIFISLIRRGKVNAL